MQAYQGFRALFEFATEGILIVDNEGTITMANPASEKMFGYGKDELTGKKIETLIPRRMHDRHVKHREDFGRNPHSRSMGIGMNLYARKKDETEFPVEVSLSPYSTESGKFVIAFVIDVTMRKKHEEQLMENMNQLQRYTEELKASNAELENFAYISSHDLQEPLRKIQAFGDRLKSSDANNLSEKGRDYLDRMLNASQRMQNLISDLLLFSRLNTRELNPVPVNLNTILRETLSDMEITIERTNAKIESDDLPVIEAEPTHMRQLLQNLISNSIKFRKDGIPPHISIHSRIIPAKPHERELAEIVISDNGIGFEEKYGDRIFNIFQRLEGKKFEGNGIGLAVCRKIALRHHGNITVKSEPGKGSTFFVTLATRI